MSSDLTNARKRKLADALTPPAVKQEAPSLLEAESVPAQVQTSARSALPCVVGPESVQALAGEAGGSRQA